MIHVEANGARIPALGLGTYKLPDDDAERMVAYALGIGYRHVDTAQGYHNERGVGRGLARAGLPREEIFLTTKIGPDDFRRDAFLRAADERLELLGVDYVDLLLLHWPNPEVPLAETLGALAEVRAAGKARHVGVSNFPTALLREAREVSDAPIVTDQVEYHPFLDQSKLLLALREAGMALTAYSPIARGHVENAALLRELGERHGKSPAQIALRWLVQQPMVVAVPKTANEERARENLDIFDFELSEEEMESVAGLARPDGRIVDPDWAPDWD